LWITSRSAVAPPLSPLVPSGPWLAAGFSVIKNTMRPTRLRLGFLLPVILLNACAVQRERAPDPRLSARPAPSAAEMRREAGLLRLDYEGFTVWLDCSKRGAVKFRYNAQHDTGQFPRAGNFALDPKVLRDCQQITADSYGNGYDRGHLVPANHLDHSATAIKQSNYMTNILPQAAAMNRGAWKLTEEIVECYRDLDELLVIGGVVWGTNPIDDYFLGTHGVETPDAFWKVVIRGRGQAIAWLIPNHRAATEARLDQYLISLDRLEQLTGERFPAPDDIKHEKPAGSWVVPIGCNKS
jgi:endonuclease G